MSARQFPAFGLLLTKEINPQKGTGGRRTAESETLISESRQENGLVKEVMAPVKAMKEKFPQVTVLADVKIADGGAIESGYAVDAGADIVTVLAIASDQTIMGARDAAHKAGREIYVDMLSVPDVVARAKELDAMGVDYIGVHTASDVQGLGKTPYEELRQISEVVKNAKIAAAGGINL